MSPTRDVRAPSESFLVAMEKYAGTAEEIPSVSVIGDSHMRNVMRTPGCIPFQVYYFELNHGTNNGNGRDGDVITGIEKGKVFGEFIKTSDYGTADADRTIEIKEGRGVILVQKNATDQHGDIIPDVVEEFEAKQIHKGQKVVIPRGSFYAFVNPDRDEVLVAKHSGRSDKNPSENPNSQALIGMRGFAYRVVACDSHVCLQPNEEYIKQNILKFKNGGIPLFGENLD